MLTFPKSSLDLQTSKMEIHYQQGKKHLHHVLFEFHSRVLSTVLVTLHSPNKVLYVVSQLSVMKTWQKI